MKTIEEAAKEYAQQDKWMYDHFGDVVMKAVFFGASWQKEQDTRDMYMSDNRHFPNDMNETWKYLVREESQFPYLKIEDSLNYFGENGWELVRIEKGKYFFKKRNTH